MLSHKPGFSLAQHAHNHSSEPHKNLGQIVEKFHLTVIKQNPNIHREDKHPRPFKPKGVSNAAADNPRFPKLPHPAPSALPIQLSALIIHPSNVPLAHKLPKYPQFHNHSKIKH
ncbi:MAG TPA: hypothetical protein VIL86_00640 [Tepidisphaeraceae bacterium]